MPGHTGRDWRLSASSACSISKVANTVAAIRDLRSSGRHPHEIIEALAAVCQPRAPELRQLSLDEIEAGMILAADVMSKTGMLLMAHGQLVTEPLLQRLRNVHTRLGVVQPILCEEAAADNPALLPWRCSAHASEAG